MSQTSTVVGSLTHESVEEQRGVGGDCGAVTQNDNKRVRAIIVFQTTGVLSNSRSYVGSIDDSVVVG